MKTKKITARILTVLMALILSVGMLPAISEPAHASDDDSSVYISLSSDGKFVVSDGGTSGVPIGYLEVPLEDVATVDLADWDLEKYAYTPYGSEGVQPDGACPTVLKLFLYLLENYYGSAGNGTPLATSGDPHQFFMNTFWGHDCNLLYYVNGAYPLYTEGWGATADGILLEEGDFVDIAMFSDWGFFQDENSGFNYFARSDSRPEEGAITHKYSAKAGEPLTVQVIRGMGNIDNGESTSYKAADDLDLHYGSEIDVDQSSQLKLSGGKAEITFEKPGTYYVWADGGIGEQTGKICSSAAVATVTVSGEDVSPGDDPTGDDPQDDPQPQVKKPAKVTGIKYKAGRKSVTASWKTVKGATVYQVRYSLKKSMAGAKTIRISGKKTKAIIKKLKKGKRYYFQIRAVKKAQGKTYSGAWSKKKAVKIPR